MSRKNFFRNLRRAVAALAAALLIPACDGDSTPSTPITLPVTTPPPPVYPANWTMSVIPAVTTVGQAGTTVTVWIKAAGGSTTVPGVPLVLEILQGRDKRTTSLIDIVPDPATGVHVTCDKLTTTSDAYGILRFQLKATAPGEEDVLQVTARPGPSQNLQTFPYATTIP